MSFLMQELIWFDILYRMNKYLLISAPAFLLLFSAGYYFFIQHNTTPNKPVPVPQMITSNIVEEVAPKMDTSLFDTLDRATSTTSLVIKDVTIGTGALAESGKTVAVYYTGMKKDGIVFDTTTTKGVAAVFPLGKGAVIKGLDEGIVGMRVGGKRLLIVPSSLGYGNEGMGKIVSPNTQLYFEVELIGVK